MSTPFAQARWIASPLVGGPRTTSPSPYFRKAFTLDKPVKSARLTITSLGVYEAEINGERVGDLVFAPGWTEYTKRVQYQTYEVGQHLRQGGNVLGAILGDGWYCGHVAWMGRQQYGDRPSLLASLEIVHKDGSKTTLLTEDSWKTISGPILESDMLMGESYDARLELGAWSKTGYDDSEWNSVLIVPDPKIALVESEGPPVRRIEEIKVVKSWERFDVWPDPQWVYDLGQNFTGRVRLKIEAPAGTALRIKHAEVLDDKNRPYYENLRSASATDSYVCRGGGVEIWEPRFTFHGFRYVEVINQKKDCKVEVTGIVLHSDTPETGSFACSHKLLNQLQRNIIWGQKSNFLEVPTDCPQRDERLGWTGDAQVFIRTACFNMDVQGFFRKWMQDARDAQYDSGAIPCVLPRLTFMDQEDGGPAWADANCICPWTIYLCYGDKEILDDHYESMARYMDYLAKDRSLNFIRSHPDLNVWGGFGDWLAMDGSGKTDGITPRDLIGTAFYAHDAEIMAKTAGLLGKKADQKKYEILRAKIVKAFQRRFITPDGLMAAGTQTSYILALKFGLVPEAAIATAVRELVRDIEKNKFHIGTGFVGTPYILDVLEEHGHLDVAYKLLEQETFPSWIFPVKNGATTIWERWDGWTTEKGFQDKGMNSFNHYAYGAVGAWMYRTVAGLELDPEEPGYDHIFFRPRPGGSITWAEAKLKTKNGLAAIHWKLKGGKLELKLTVPKGSRATFLPPEGYTSTTKKLGPGTHTVTATRKK